MAAFSAANFSGPTAADPLGPSITAEVIQPACQEDDGRFVVTTDGCARIRGHIAASDAAEKIGGRKAPLAPAAPWVFKMGGMGPSNDPAPLDMDFLPPRRDAFMR